MSENKALFVERLNDALVECGDGRYDDLKRSPMRYEELADKRTGKVMVEKVVREFTSFQAEANVTGDSLTGIMKDVVRQGLI